MAWVATADFNGLSDGNLAGQGGGSGWSGNWVNGATAQMLVTGTSTYEGAKSVDTVDASSGTFYYRPVTSAVSGDGNIVYFAMRKSLNNSGEVSGGLRTAGTPGTSRIAVKLDASGNMVLSGSTSATLLTGYSVDTWYVIRLTFNVDANTATAAYSTTAFGGSGSWSAESSAVTMNSSGDIGNFQIQSDPNAGTSYLDYISDTEPFSPIQNLTIGIDTASYTLTANDVGLGRIMIIVIDTAQYIFTSFSILLKKMGWEATPKNNVTMSVTSKNNSTWTPRNKS